jgi:hypothetical protein
MVDESCVRLLNPVRIMNPVGLLNPVGLMNHARVEEKNPVKK